MSANPADKNSPVQPSTLPQVDRVEAILSEYEALRNEVLKRLEFRYQIINLTLVVAGTFLSVGVQPNISPAVLLVYPILAMFLITGWIYNLVQLRKLGNYIRDNIEAKLVVTGWESYLTGRRRQADSFQPLDYLGTISTGGLFLSTQILSVVLAFLKSLSTATDYVLLLCSLIAIFITLFLLKKSTQI